ncbi:MAG TPA: DUF5069 domain-containing protein [Verrucomicrobiae bacterium]|nr:DUF5069 domain-containing protein [Verrucomicrobiae bacterium]
MMNKAKDLTREAPRSPRVRINGYALLARMADKGRATINGTAGEYHFDCPLDNMLFGFKGVTGADVRPLLESGASDEEIANWFNTHGTPKTPAEVKQWSDTVEAARPYDDPEKREWFTGECQRLGLDPKTTTLFEMLERDDRESFKSFARAA